MNAPFAQPNFPQALPPVSIPFLACAVLTPVYSQVSILGATVGSSGGAAENVGEGITSHSSTGQLFDLLSCQANRSDRRLGCP
jgi:hypothetical protein